MLGCVLGCTEGQLVGCPVGFANGCFVGTVVGCRAGIVTGKPNPVDWWIIMRPEVLMDLMSKAGYL